MGEDGHICEAWKGTCGEALPSHGAEGSGPVFRMRSNETAAQAGVLIVAPLAIIVLVDTVQSGFLAIRSGEPPLWGLKACLLSTQALLR